MMVDVTADGNVMSHTPRDNTAPFNSLVSNHPSDDDCVSDTKQVEAYLDYAAEVMGQIPARTYIVDLAMVGYHPCVVETIP